MSLLSGSSSAFLGGINSFLVPREPFREASPGHGDGLFFDLLKFLRFSSVLVRHTCKLTRCFPQQLSPGCWSLARALLQSPRTGWEQGSQQGSEEADGQARVLFLHSFLPRHSFPGLNVYSQNSFLKPTLSFSRIQQQSPAVLNKQGRGFVWWMQPWSEDRAAGLISQVCLTPLCNT